MKVGDKYLCLGEPLRKGQIVKITTVLSLEIWYTYLTDNQKCERDKREFLENAVKITPLMEALL